jgi:hypothetical protein
MRRCGCHVIAPQGAVSESWVPAVEVAGQLVVEDAGADLEQGPYPRMMDTGWSISQRAAA